MDRNNLLMICAMLSMPMCACARDSWQVELRNMIKQSLSTGRHHHDDQSARTFFRHVSEITRRDRVCEDVRGINPSHRQRQWSYVHSACGHMEYANKRSSAERHQWMIPFRTGRYYLNITAVLIEIPAAHEHCLNGFLSLATGDASSKLLCGNLPPFAHTGIFKSTANITVHIMNIPQAQARFILHYQLTKSLKRRKDIILYGTQYESANAISLQFPFAENPDETSISVLLTCDVLHTIEASLNFTSASGSRGINWEFFNGLFGSKQNNLIDSVRVTKVLAAVNSTSFNLLILVTRHEQTRANQGGSSYSLEFTLHEQPFLTENATDTQTGEFSLNETNLNCVNIKDVLLCHKQFKANKDEYLSLKCLRLRNPGYTTVDCNFSGFAVLDSERLTWIRKYGIRAADHHFPVLKLCNTGVREDHSLFIKSYTSVSNSVHVLFYSFGGSTGGFEVSLSGESTECQGVFFRCEPPVGKFSKPWYKIDEPSNCGFFYDPDEPNFKRGVNRVGEADHKFAGVCHRVYPNYIRVNLQTYSDFKCLMFQHIPSAEHVGDCRVSTQGRKTDLTYNINVEYSYVTEAGDHRHDNRSILATTGFGDEAGFNISGKFAHFIAHVVPTCKDSLSIRDFDYDAPMATPRVFTLLRNNSIKEVPSCVEETYTRGVGMSACRAQKRKLNWFECGTPRNHGPLQHLPVEPKNLFAVTLSAFGPPSCDAVSGRLHVSISVERKSRMKNSDLRDAICYIELGSASSYSFNRLAVDVNLAEMRETPRRFILFTPTYKREVFFEPLCPLLKTGWYYDGDGCLPGCHIQYNYSVSETFATLPTRMDEASNSSQFPVPADIHSSNILFSFWVNGQYSWQKASSLCSTYGGTLPSIHSEEDEEILLRFALGDGFGDEEVIPTPCRLFSTVCLFYIGWKHHESGIYTDGDVMTYQNWAQESDEIVSVNIKEGSMSHDDPTMAATHSSCDPANDALRSETVLDMRDLLNRDGKPEDERKCVLLMSTLRGYETTWVNVPCTKETYMPMIICQRRVPDLRLKRRHTWLMVHMASFPTYLRPRSSFNSSERWLQTMGSCSKETNTTLTVDNYEMPKLIAGLFFDTSSQACFTHGPFALSATVLDRMMITRSPPPDSVWYRMRNRALEDGACLTEPCSVICPEGFVGMSRRPQKTDAMFGCVSDRYVVDGFRQFLDIEQCTRSSRANETACVSANFTSEAKVDLLWTCSRTERIHTTKLCDGVLDCANGNDEICFGLTVANETEDAGNARETCGEGYLPCSTGRGQCFLNTSICLYDVDHANKMKFCSDGSHLKNCSHRSGSFYTFKCPLYYSVPAHRVCNGVADCPGGEDEVACMRQGACPGMVKCRSGLCVSLGYVCDGVAHCPDGEEEAVCARNTCPLGCTCLGFSIRCDGVTMLGNLTGWKLLRLHDAFAAHSLPAIGERERVVYLNISHNFLANVPLEYLQGCYNIHILDLSHNSITAFRQGIFASLVKTTNFYLSNNPITFIPSDLFSGLTEIRLVDLSSSDVAHITLDFANASSLRNLIFRKIETDTLLIKTVGSDMNDLTIDVFEAYLKQLDVERENGSEVRVTVITGFREFCCVIGDAACQTPEGTRLTCSSGDSLGVVLINIATSFLTLFPNALSLTELSSVKGKHFKLYLGNIICADGLAFLPTILLLLSSIVESERFARVACPAALATWEISSSTSLALSAGFYFTRMKMVTALVRGSEDAQVFSRVFIVITWIFTVTMTSLLVLDVIGGVKLSVICSYVGVLQSQGMKIIVLTLLMVKLVMVGVLLACLILTLIYINKTRSELKNVGGMGSSSSKAGNKSTVLLRLQFVQPLMYLIQLGPYILILSDEILDYTWNRILVYTIFPVCHIANPVVNMLIPFLKDSSRKRKTIAIKSSHI